MGGFVDAKVTSYVSIIYDDGSMDLGARDINLESNGIANVVDGGFDFWEQ